MSRQKKSKKVTIRELFEHFIDVKSKKGRKIEIAYKPTNSKQNRPLLTGR